MSLKSAGLPALAFFKPLAVMQAADARFIRSAQASGVAAIEDEAVHATTTTTASRLIVRGKGVGLLAKQKVFG